jgi:hypothetical protein
MGPSQQELHSRDEKEGRGEEETGGEKSSGEESPRGESPGGEARDEKKRSP